MTLYVEEINKVLKTVLKMKYMDCQCYAMLKSCNVVAVRDILKELSAVPA